MLRSLAFAFAFAFALGAVLCLPTLAADRNPPNQKVPAKEKAPAKEAAPVTDKSPPKVTGIYGTMQSFGSESAVDMVGIEVTIVRSREGLHAIVQTADGIPTKPVVYPIDYNGTTLIFPIPDRTGEPVEFKGRVTSQGLVGTLSGKPLTLPRRPSVWQ